MSTDTATVSILMNCYNCEQFLEQAIESVYSQTFTDWEIIFWDNASTDCSGKIAQSYDQRLKYYRAIETTTLGEARNLAMKEAKGKYIAFLDCDDLYLPDKLKKQVSIMENGNYNMSYGSAIVIDEEGRRIRKLPVTYKSGYIFENLLKRYEINMQSVMVRRTILEKDELVFQPNLQYCPDHNLFMEIASRYPTGVIKDFIVKYRVISNSLSKKTLHLVSSEIKYTLNRIFERDPGLRKKYNETVSNAYSKLNYYDAISMISENNFKEARTALSTVLAKRWEYVALYVLLFLPISKNFILKLLKR